MVLYLPTDELTASSTTQACFDQADTCTAVHTAPRHASASTSTSASFGDGRWHLYALSLRNTRPASAVSTALLRLVGKVKRVSES